MTDEAHSDWYNPMGDPMVSWMLRNGIDFERVPMFPEIQLLGESEMMVEYFWGYDDEPNRARLLRRRVATRMVRRPVRVPMEPELWEVYQRSRAAYLAENALKTLGQAGATVLTAKPGSNLVFVCANPMTEDHAFLEEASRILQESLPGVGVQIMTGVDTILHRAPQDER